MREAQLAFLFSCFPDLDEGQRQQIRALYDLYVDWNARINVISRKDIENLYLHHVLHSLGIVHLLRFAAGSRVLDFGTGGGFPGIPLAIFFPASVFHLIDATGKKIKVGQAVAEAIGLRNVTFRHCRGEEEEGLFDFVVSRAVMPLDKLAGMVGRNIRQEQRNALPNGLICLKGGNLDEELQPFRRKAIDIDLETCFNDPYFNNKKVIYIPLI